MRATSTSFPGTAWPVLLLALVFSAGLCLPLSAAKKEGPLVKLVVLDRNLKTVISNYQSEIQKLTSKEKKKDSFVYTVTIRKTNYNPYSTTFAVPSSYTAPIFWSTNYLTPFFREMKEFVSRPKFTNVVISGFIRDADKNPLPNVMVQLFDDNMSVIKDYLTTADGRYVFSNLPPKTYTIRSASTKDLIEKKISVAKAPELVQTSLTQKTESAPQAEKSEKNQPQQIKTGLADSSILILVSQNQSLTLKHEMQTNIKGLIVGIWEEGREYFITPFGTLTGTLESAANVRTNTFITIDGNSVRYKGQPLFRDGEPFSLQLYAVYKDGTVSDTPLNLENITTRDSIPPPLPSLDTVSLLPGSIFMSWHRLTPDREELAYRIYQKQADGYTVLDEIRDYTTNGWVTRVIPLKPGMEASNLTLTVTAIDRSGNESEFQKAYMTVTASSNRSVDLVLDTSLGPPVIFERPAPPVVIPPRKFTAFELFVRNGYSLRPGAVLRIDAKKIVLPAGTRIMVPSRSRLVLEDVVLTAKSNSSWLGIEINGGSIEIVRSTLKGAVRALGARNSSRVSVRDSSFVRNKTAVYSEDSRIDLRGTLFLRNAAALIVRGGSTTADGVTIASNAAGASFENCGVTIARSVINGNGSGLELHGCRGSVVRSAIAGNRDNGIYLDSSAVSLASCLIAGNAKNGVLCADSNPEIRACDIRENLFYAVKSGGRLVDCFVGRNNRSLEVDNTPDSGSDDGRAFTYSNSSLQQIYAVDSIRGLSAEEKTEHTPNLKQEK